MLLANLAKSPSLERLVSLRRKTIPALSTSPLAITQLLELFNVGATGKFNKDATYDYLAYLFADLAKVSISASILQHKTPITGIKIPTADSLAYVTSTLPSKPTSPPHPQPDPPVSSTH